MQLSNSPAKFPLAFAASGSKNTIPVDSQVGITPGAASLTDGFPPLTRTPISAGGVAPSGLDMNGILYEMSASLRWTNAGGGYAYDGTFATDANVNGYPKGARVMRADAAGYWLSTVENNTTDPDAGGAGWVPDYMGGASLITMTNANVTLTAPEYGKQIIVITGTLSANLNLIFPAIPSDWSIINNTSGAYSITAKTASGTGVVLGAVTQVIGDGTNIYTQTSGAVVAAASAPVGSSRNAKMSVTSAGASGTFTADEIIVATALGGTSYRLGSYSQTINLSTTGAGGMDTGSAPVSGFVSLYAIAKTDGTKNILACNVTTSAGSIYSGANLPSGYSASALIGFWPTNGSGQFVPGLILGRKFWNDAGGVNVLNITATPPTSYTSVSLATAIPPAAVGVTMSVGQPLGGNAQMSAEVAASSTGLASAIVNLYGNAYVVDGFYSGVPVSLPVLTSQTAYYRVGTSVNGVRINVTGFDF